jgi:hypothetical protein
VQPVLAFHRGVEGGEQGGGGVGIGCGCVRLVCCCARDEQIGARCAAGLLD